MDHISEQTMYDLVDGELSPEEENRVIKHLSECEVCKKEMSYISAFEGGLRLLWEEHLSKACPDEEDLFTYFEGWLGAEKQKEMEKHLEDCVVCRASIRLAEQARDRFNALDEAKNVIVPSLIESVKAKVKKLDIPGLLVGMERTFAPSRLGEELFAFLSKSLEALTYSFSTPLETPALLPVSAGGVKLADTGKGFLRKVVVEEGVPFEVELVQFGDRFLININSRDEAHRQALVKYILSEESHARRQGLLLVSDGKASLRLSEDEVEELRPEKTPLGLKLEVVLEDDILSRIGTEEIIGLLERLRELVVSGDPESATAALDALRKIDDLVSRES